MFTSVTTVVKAEWIKDQQNKWVYYENDSSKLNYNMTENYRTDEVTSVLSS